MTHHTDEEKCPKCWELLETAHYYLVMWFWKLKARHPSAHIACAWRSQAEQNRAVADGKSQLPWPKSAHNHMNADGQPESLALDLFQIDDDGVARWSPTFMAKVNAENEEDREPLLWGGTFKTLGDSCHFQYKVKT